MTKSEFARAVSAEFGVARGRFLTRDLVLDGTGGRTADEAIAAGIDPRSVWLALCVAADVPEARRYGVGRPESPRD